MIGKHQGIVLRIFLWKESSYIASIFTQNEGKLSFLIPAALATKRKNTLGPLQVGYIIDFIGYIKANRNIQKLTESSLHYAYTTIPYNPVSFLYLSLVIELIDKSIREQDPNPFLYNSLKEYLITLDKGTQNAYYLTLSFLIEVTRYLGFFPHIGGVLDPERPIKFIITEGRFENTSSENPAARYLYQIVWQNQNPTHNSNNIELPKNYKLPVLRLLIDYFSAQVENFSPLNSLPVFLQIFS
ncbi:MAG: DNA repair protein RecO [Bacteroidia bacterium]|nr:DNA repair protein RecO [Bacteroidia bacterium]MDW8158578.1 DNA repair protein RecO [Bacteroidia bacterium]